ncbi:MAG TPA: AAA family ATPase [Armatimonadota bacterium]|jgi:predicted ATPase
MRLSELRIQGFRSLEDVTWRPGSLNVVVGPNASGKSNLLRAFEMLQAAATGRLGRFIQAEGGMGAVVWNGAVGGLHLGVDVAQEGSGDVADSGSALRYRLDLDRLGVGSSFTVASETLQPTVPGRAGAVDEFISRHGHDWELLSVMGGLKSGQGGVPEDETLLSTTGVPLSSLPTAAVVQSFLAGWTVYSEISTGRSSSLRQAAVTRHTSHVEPDGSNLVNVLHTLYPTDRRFRQDVDDAMSAAFGSEYEEVVIPPVADQRVQLGVRWRSLRSYTPAADLSDGTLRFLLLVTILASPDPPSLIAIDEPETGLHPSMLPIVAEYAASAAKRSQVVLTTHSPDLLSAFEGEVPTTTVAEAADGATALHVLEGDALRYWIDKYKLGEMYRSGELEALR